jgi:hypothetical protein
MACTWRGTVYGRRRRNVSTSVHITKGLFTSAASVVPISSINLSDFLLVLRPRYESGQAHCDSRFDVGVQVRVSAYRRYLRRWPFASQPSDASASVAQAQHVRSRAPGKCPASGIKWGTAGLPVARELPNSHPRCEDVIPKTRVCRRNAAGAH